MIAPDRSFPNGSPVCEYWLSRCEGFVVRAGHRTLGVVEEVAHDGRHADAIVLRRGRHRRKALRTNDVLAVVPARRLLLARRHHHAAPAARSAYATLRPFVVSMAAAIQGFVLWLVATLQREVPRLTRILVAEIRDRNANHGPEPSVGRAHRKANDYGFAVNQQPLGRGRNVGPT